MEIEITMPHKIEANSHGVTRDCAKRIREAIRGVYHSLEDLPHQDRIDHTYRWKDYAFAKAKLGGNYQTDEIIDNLSRIIDRRIDLAASVAKLQARESDRVIPHDRRRWVMINSDLDASEQLWTDRLHHAA